MEKHENLAATLSEIIDRKHSTPTERELAQVLREALKRIENLEGRLKMGPAFAQAPLDAGKDKGDASDYTKG